MATKRVFDGLTLVTVGAILLANTTGVLPWSVWLSIFLLWPLLVVSVGIDILGRATDSPVLRALSSLVVIAGLVYGALSGAGHAPALTFGSGRGEPFHYAQPGSPASGEARINAGLARVKLTGGPGLATADGATPFGTPRFEATTTGGKAQVRIDSGGSGGEWRIPSARESFLDATLSSSTVWERIEVDAGVSDVRLDLRDVVWNDLVVNTGLSTTEIDFGALNLQPAPSMPSGSVPGPVPSSRDRTAIVSGGLASYKLRVPKGVGVELRVDNGLGSVKVPSSWKRVGGDGPFQGTWRSDGYDAAQWKLQVTVKAGLSGVVVEAY